MIIISSTTRMAQSRGVPTFYTGMSETSVRKRLATSGFLLKEKRYFAFLEERNRIAIIIR